MPTFDDQGRLVLAVASLEDVTSLRAAEAGRAAAEGLFRAVFDGSPAATAIVDLDGRFAQVNEALAMILGYSVDELVGRTFAEITHPDDLAVDLELLDEVLAGTRNGYQMEKRYFHRAGHEVWAELSVATVRDATGAITHFVSTIEDITSRKAVLGGADSNGDLAYWAVHDHLTGLPNRRYLDNYLASTFGPRRRASDRLVGALPRPRRLQAGQRRARPPDRRRGPAHHRPPVAQHLPGGRAGGPLRRRRVRRRHPQAAHRPRRVAPGRADPQRRPHPDRRAHARAPIVVGASVGIGVAGDGDEPAEVLRRADAASYRAKREGKNRARYQDSDDGAGEPVPAV